MIRTLPLLAVLATAAAGGAYAQEPPKEAPKAAETFSAPIKNAKGDTIGSLAIRDGANALVLRVAIQPGGLPPGWHGMHFHAVGDCAGYWQLAHTAFREGEVAAENACGHEAVVDLRAVPRPIYTDPEIAGVGLTEAQAREQHGDDVAVGVFPWVANARAVMQNETVGWVKSIHETKYGELLGLVMVGPHVTDLVEAGVVAIDAEATVETVADGVAPHPTLSEAIKEAGLVALGRAIHLPPKRR